MNGQQTLLRVVIPGTPRGWRQVKVSHNFSRLTDNALAWQQDAIARMKWAHGSRPPIHDPVRLEILALFPRPQDFDCQHKPIRCPDRPPGKRLCPPEKMSGAARPHASTPDLTNIVKLAEDAVTRAGVIHDDCLVGGQVNDKRYAAADEEPGVYITLRSYL